MTPQTPLTRPQLRAIDALLEHGSRETAAKAAKVSVRSLTRWSGQDAFNSELAKRRTRLLTESANVLTRGAAACARSLVAMGIGMLKGSTARALACRTVLDLARRGAELDDISQRLAELEAAAAAQAPPKFARQFS